MLPREVRSIVRRVYRVLVLAVPPSVIDEGYFVAVTDIASMQERRSTTISGGGILSRLPAVAACQNMWGLKRQFAESSVMILSAIRKYD